MTNTTTEKRIRQIMANKDWSLGDLSEQTDIPKTTLHRYLSDTDTIPLDRVKILSKALSTTPEFLLGWDTEENSAYGNHQENLQYFSDKPEVLELYKQIYEDESLTLLFDSARSLKPDELEKVLNYMMMVKENKL